MSVGVALGSGGAAAVAQIGVLDALAEAGIAIDAVAGTSAGAIVGAVRAAGTLARFRDTLLSFTRRRVLRLFNPRWTRGALLDFAPALELLREFVPQRIEQLPIPFAAVAVDLTTCEEITLRRGPIDGAIAASCAIPGLFPSFRHDGRWLADGALANPLPVDVARGLGGRFVIAVNVLVCDDEQARRFARECLGPSATRLRDLLFGSRRASEAPAPWAPDSVAEVAAFAWDGSRSIDVVSQAVRLVQWRIAAMRLQRDRPDVLINVPVGDVGLFSLHRAAELVERGRRAAADALPAIRAALARRSSPGVLRRGWHRFAPPTRAACAPAG